LKFRRPCPWIELTALRRGGWTIGPAGTCAPGQQDDARDNGDDHRAREANSASARFSSQLHSIGYVSHHGPPIAINWTIGFCSRDRCSPWRCRPGCHCWAPAPQERGSHWVAYMRFAACRSLKLPSSAAGSFNGPEHQNDGNASHRDRENDCIGYISVSCDAPSPCGVASGACRVSNRSRQARLGASLTRNFRGSRARPPSKYCLHAPSRAATYH
jgi:hypothetical protein